MRYFARVVGDLSAHLAALATSDAMGNSFSGGDATWPTRRVATRQFVEMPEKEASIATATFGAGCYWGTEKWYAKDFVKDWDAPEGAVLATSVGFMCGRPEGCKRDPTYREVCSGSTGHVEVCQVKYDPGKTSYERLAKHFFTFHDPTTKNRQGNDAARNTPRSSSRTTPNREPPRSASARRCVEGCATDAYDPTPTPTWSPRWWTPPIITPRPTRTRGTSRRDPTAIATTEEGSPGSIKAWEGRRP